MQDQMNPNDIAELMSRHTEAETEMKGAMYFWWTLPISSRDEIPNVSMFLVAARQSLVSAIREGPPQHADTYCRMAAKLAELDRAVRAAIPP